MVMASRILPPQTTAQNPVATSGAEAYVDDQIQKARQRVRAADIGKATLGLVLAALAYAVIVAYLDRWLLLPSLVRQGAFCLFAVVAAAFVAWSMLRPLSRQINPYYAARQVERNIPKARNSLINWLDLHRQPLAPAFRSAINSQAARDLADVDVEEVVSERPSVWLLAATAVFAALLFFLFISSPRQFISLLGRAFAPFRESTIATRTQLTLLEPAGGNVVLPVGKALTVDVRVDGRVPDPRKPDALRVLYRTSEADPFESRLLEVTEDNRLWRTTLLATDIKTGLDYKIAGGDAETPDYHVTVRSRPLLTDVRALYHYRPYLHWPDRTADDPNLKDLRGTEVLLTAFANRDLRDAQMVIDKHKPISPELDRKNPRMMRFRLTLEEDAGYRILFTSVDGERLQDPVPYTIRVLPDQAPVAVLNKPGKDVELAVNDVLGLEGQASDDLGLASVTLHLRRSDGRALQSRPYRGGKSLQRPDGTYPQVLEFKDFLDLTQLRHEDGSPYTPEPKQMIEYWLEARDHCDYPAPNKGESTHWKITFREPISPKEQQEHKQQAEQEQRKHEQKQDEKQQQEQQQANQENPENTPPRQDEQTGQKSSDQAGQPGQKPSDQASQSEDQRLDEQANKLKDQIDKNEKQGSGGQKDSSQKSGNQEGNQGKNDAGSSSRDTERTQEKGSKSGNQSSQEKGTGQEKDKNAGKQSPDGNSGDQQQQNSDKGATGQKQGTEEGKNDKTQNQQEGGKQNEGQPGKDGAGKNQDGAGGMKEGGNKGQENSKTGAENKKQNGSPATGSRDSGQSGEKKDNTKNKEGSAKDGAGDAQGKQNRPGSEKGSSSKEGSRTGDDSAPKEGSEKSATNPMGGGKEADGQQKPSDASKGQEKPARDNADPMNKGTGSDQKQGQRPAGKPNSDQKTGAGQSEKPARDAGNTEPPPDAKTRSDDKSTREAVEQLQKDLNSADPRTREEAQQKLEQLRKQAQDPVARRALEKMKEAADKAGDKQRSGDDKESGQGSKKSAGEKANGTEPKPGDQGKGEDTKKPASTENADDKRPEKGDPGAKDGGKDPSKEKSGKAQEKGNGRDLAGNKGDPSQQDQGQAGNQPGSSNPRKGQPGKPDPAAKDAPKGPGAPGSTSNENPTPGQGTGQTNPQPEEKVDATTGQRRAGDLILDDLKKKVNDDILKKVNMTPEEYKKFLQAYEAMLKRKQSRPARPDDVVPPQQGGMGLPNRGVRQVESGAKQDTNAQRLGQSLPPAELRDAEYEFKKRINELRRDGDKK